MLPHEREVIYKIGLGAIRTQGSGNRGNEDPPVAAKAILARVDELTEEHSGKFFHANGQALPW